MILFINEKLDGFGFQWINNNQNSFWYTLDRDLHDASEVRWHVMYNLTVLKIISFGMDWYWSLNKIQKLDVSKHECQQCSNKEICYKVRQEQNQSPSNFTFSAYLGYLLYVPLLIAGPTTTFNAWISHIKKAQTTYSKKRICLYVLRTALIFLSFEIFIHISKSFAFLTNEKNKYLTSQISVPTLCIMSLAALMFIWYKFLSIWRFFRCWALLDGIETPENMNRCICNNYCFEGFWRSWHRSFNQWLIRYIFIPCGGSKYKQYNIWVVFTFVAFWHDINISLMVWAWVICLSLIPEIIVKAYFNQKKFDYIWGQYWFIFLCLLTGSFYITLMILANMIGFASGVQGTGGILDRLQTIDGFLGYLKFLFCLIPFTSLQFYIRDQEQKQSKNLKGM
ncbi:hypothetical protein PPERSA_05623 [Pseudocohnilembus persalinus]|uniref:Membrane bound O-acyl transferase, MBOAT n=1 Tax=Pseudocohnilembus persalinus TaxID=266149 RepID=A0A0V0QQP6_PSEPJ|nr:hypothetical protein PPERSA_05623 [Pseudocohnilembus persalinus]|eukprot:KRX04362.1 hypothetical protein PPERSA_05623 [Pseudocohnilembus persalinus]